MPRISSFALLVSGVSDHALVVNLKFLDIRHQKPFV